ncbi:hypothetical protein B4U79_14422 [Dinothrombium tinctorium]|uniref:Thioredoxin domain-containing protein 17 n=1 Tax=Dinothrombium tinctorium TaxID=1965070 RepID=A0A3S3SF74_9ACAR|nr:hypothetical protein B4U79_14422 [Dinothrombium tinctorium]
MNKISVNSLNELLQLLDAKKNEYAKIFILFTGSKNSDGVSWCPDCNIAQPVMEKVFADCGQDTLLVTAFVGQRDAWKNSENEFRRDKQFQIRSVPTLIKFGSVSIKPATKEMVKKLLEE